MRTGVGRAFGLVGVLGLVTGAAVAFAGVSAAVVPSDGGPLTLFPVTIKAGAGDQYDPHASGDIASYTENSRIRYYNFATGVDLAVPAPVDAVDHLSDVSNGRIVFSRDEVTGRSPILVYDIGAGTTAEIDPQTASPVRSMPAIGADTVVFDDFLAAYPGELFVSELGGSTQRLTNDTRIEQHPSVSPLGDVIVWESCESSSANCDIRKAVKVGSSWTLTAMTTNSEPEANPDTDGTVVVYDATRSGERDIYWQPVGGGPEQRLELAGEQRKPSVSAGVILFESVPVGETTADLFVYRIATDSLFRITSTPGLDENLNDITGLPDGSLHIVWSSGAAGDRNVFGATFTLPPLATTTTVSSDHPSSSFGQPVTFSAAVTTSGSVPTGFVQFTVDGLDFGAPIALDGSGHASSVSTATLTVANHVVTATFTDGPNFATSSGTLAGGQTVNAAATTTTVNSDSPDPSLVGQHYSVAVTVAASPPGAGVPSGTVAVGDGNGNTCPITLSGGSGSCNLVSTGAGNKTLSVSYSGDASFGASSATAQHAVTAPASAAPEVLLPVIPVIGQGAQNQTIAVVGSHFQPGATVAVSGTGITVNSVSYAASWLLTANVSVSPTAAVGWRNLTVTNPDSQNGGCTNCLRVNAGPAVSSVSPTSAKRGTSLNVTLNGSNFAVGAKVSFGSGVAVNSVTRNSASVLKASITVASNAALGARNVTVTNLDGGTTSCAACFAANSNA